MKVEDYQRCYYEMTGKASDIARSLGLAGLAVIWIFKVDNPDSVFIAADLVRGAIWIVAALAFDLLQYLYLAAIWLFISNIYERKYGHEKSGLSHSPWWPRVGEFIFVAKIICLGFGYWFIAIHLLDRLRLTP